MAYKTAAQKYIEKRRATQKIEPPKSEEAKPMKFRPWDPTTETAAPRKMEKIEMSATISPQEQPKTVEKEVVPPVEQPTMQKDGVVTQEAPITPTTPEMTVEEQARGLVDYQFQEQKQQYEKLFGEEEDLPTSLDEYVAQFKEQQEEEMSRAERDIAFEQEQEEQQFRRMSEQGQASIGSITASLAQGREGAMSALAPKATQEYKTTIQQNIGQARGRLDMANTRREELLSDLQDAQRAGREDLAKGIEAQLANAELQITQARTELLNAQSQASDLAINLMQTTQDSYNSFKDLVGTGAVMSPDSIFSTAQQLGIDPMAAYDYYQGVQSIRDSKSLDLVEKAQLIDEKNMELDMMARGVTTEKLQNIDYLENLYRSGATQEEISRTKQVLGITDEMDPVYQMTLRQMSAETKMAELEAANYGKPPQPGTKEYFEYEKARLEVEEAKFKMQDLYGTTTVNVDRGAIYNDVFPVGNVGGWCGVYASTVSTGPKVGNSWSEKKQRISHRTNPQQGNKLLIPMGVGTDGKGYGHVAVVLDFDPISGNITTLESNADGRQNTDRGGNVKGVITIENRNINELNATYGTNWGFTTGELKEPYKSQIQKQVEVQEEAMPKIGDKPLNQFTDTDITTMNEYFNSGGKTFPYWADTPAKKKEFESMANKLKDAQNSADTDIRDIIKYSVGNKERIASVQEKLDQFADISSRLETLDAAMINIDEGDMGPLLGRISSANPYETNVQAVDAMLTGLLPGLARGVFGEVGVLTDADMARYAGVLPNVKNTEDLNDVLADMLQTQMVRSLENQLRSAAGNYDVSDYGWVLDQIEAIEKKNESGGVSMDWRDQALDMANKLNLMEVQSLYNDFEDPNMNEYVNYYYNY